jgi:hypothetical protein
MDALTLMPCLRALGLTLSLEGQFVRVNGPAQSVDFMAELRANRDLLVAALRAETEAAGARPR